MSLRNEEQRETPAGEAGARAYDLVVIDIDGTLLTSKHRIPASVAPLVEEVQSRGIGVTLATGRPRLTLLPAFTELKLTLPYISSGGAFIFDPATQQVLYRCALRYEQVALCVEQARAAQVAIVSQMPDHLYYEGDVATWEELKAVANVDNAVVDGGRTSLTRVPDVLFMCPQPLKMTLCGEPGTVSTIEQALRQREASLHLTYSGPPYLEITRSEASKGEAIKRLASCLGIVLERVIAIGDSSHDISMLEAVGTAVAMGNAGEEVKAVADLVAPSNDEDGVAWTLRELVLAGRQTGAGPSSVGRKAHHRAAS